MATPTGKGHLKPQWEVAVVYTTPGCPPLSIQPQMVTEDAHNALHKKGTIWNRIVGGTGRQNTNPGICLQSLVLAETIDNQQ
jgi:hypothetical protein